MRYAGRLFGLLGKLERRINALVLLVLFSVSSAAMADDVFSPMLTVRMGDQVIELEPEQFAALPQSQLLTSTTLQPEVGQWRGVLGRDVLALLGIPEGEVRAMSMTSWDDYRIDMTTEDFYRWDVLLANEMDGQVLTVNELGPLRVTYPRDQHEELQDARFDHRWVWMLREIVVAPK